MMLTTCHILLLILGTVIADNCETPYDVSKFCKSDHLIVSYEGNEVKCGDELTTGFTATKPSIQFKGASQGKKYTLIMADPDAPGENDFRHYLVADITAKGLQSDDGNLEGNVLTEYQGPSPPAGSGSHKYNFWLYEQEKEYSINIPDDRSKWDVSQFAKDAKLCKLAATFQYTVEQK